MAFFRFRKSGEEQSATPVKPESVEAMRRRAKHRLIGAAVLLLIGVIGFPLMFDKQPRPIAVDTPIEIPDRNKVRPLSIPAPVANDDAKPAQAVAGPATSITPVAAAPIIEEKEVAPPAAVAPEAPKTVAKAEPKAIEKPVEKPLAKADDANQVQALLEGKAADKSADASEGRYVVQVGAFADATRAQAVRLKVERAGLKTYTQVAGTKETPRIRVRIGPFGTKAEADKVSEKIKHLDLPAAILNLEKQP